MFLYALSMFILALTSRSWIVLHFSQVHVLTPSPIRGSISLHFEHVRVESLSEISLYIEAAQMALYFNIFLNIPIPESSDIPASFLLRFMNLQGTSPTTIREHFLTSFVDSLCK